MVGPGDFVDGVTINYRRLAVTLFGAGLLAYFEGAVASFLSLVNIPLALLSGLTDWYREFTRLLYGAPADLVGAAFGAASRWVVGVGPLGYVAGIAIALASLYSLAWVISNVR